MIYYTLATWKRPFWSLTVVRLSLYIKLYVTEHLLVKSYVDVVYLYPDSTWNLYTIICSNTAWQSKAVPVHSSVVRHEAINIICMYAIIYASVQCSYTCTIIAYHKLKLLSSWLPCNVVTTMWMRTSNLWITAEMMQKFAHCRFYWNRKHPIGYAHTSTGSWIHIISARSLHGGSQLETIADLGRA